MWVVPFDYDLALNPNDIQYDGIFVSNGPGDPSMCSATIASLRWAITKIHPPKPVFGICLGNQLLALAAGAKTYKMKFGNRGMNQPCIDLRTSKCYITSQVMVAFLFFYSGIVIIFNFDIQLLESWICCGQLIFADRLAPHVYQCQ